MESYIKVNRLGVIFYFLLVVFGFVGCDDLLQKDNNVVLPEPVLNNPVDKDFKAPTSPTFYWNAVTSGDRNVVYDLYLGERSIDNLKSFQTSIKDPFFKMKTALKSSTTYFWKIVARIPFPTSGIPVSNSSSVYSFRTIRSPIRVTGVSIDKSTLSLQIGSSEYVTALSTPFSADDKRVKWLSADTRVAIVSNIDFEGTSTVDSGGNNYIKSPSKATVLAVGVGVTVVTVTSRDGNFSKEVTVNVTKKPKPVQSVSINSNDFSIPIGQSIQLLTSIVPRDADNKVVSWSLNPPQGRATINSNGVLVGKTEGQVQVIVVTDDNNFSDKIVVTFTTPVVPAVNLSVDKKQVSVLVSGKVKVTAKVSPDDATYQKVIWESGDELLVGVQNGIITGRRVTDKDTFVTARLEDYSDIEIIAVRVISNPILIQDVDFRRQSAKMVIGRRTKIDYRIAPSDATDKTLIWDTSDANIATVNESGFVNAVSSGKATISVRSTSGVQRSFKVTVMDSDPQRPNLDGLLSSKKYRFIFSGKLYYIINLNKTWRDAATFAKNLSGTDEYIHLLHINSKEEQQGIIDAIKKSKLNFDVSLEGNGSQLVYLWTGATDAEKENTWIWNGDGGASSDYDELLGTGRGFYSGTPQTWSTAVQGNNFWGQSVNGQQLEPDGGNGQKNNPEEDYLALSLGTWLNGSTYQWNDLSGDKKYPFIIEVE